MPLSLQTQGFRVTNWRGILTHLGRFEDGQLIPAGTFTDQQLFGMLHAGQIKKQDEQDDDDYEDNAAVTVSVSAVQPKRRGSGRRKNAT